MSLSSYDRLKQALDGIVSPTTRAIVFLVLLGDVLRERGARLPIIVGGAALEIYTMGQYMSHDIDLKSDFEVTMAVLKEMGFRNDGRSLMYSQEFDLLVDWQGSALEEGREAEGRVLKVRAIDGQSPVALIALEDLIIDRLEAYKYGRDRDALRWAQTLFALGRNNELALDAALLRRLAQAADVEDALERLCDE